MTEASRSFAGNLTDQPELRHTEGGIARAMSGWAVSGRRDQEASFFTVVVWRDQAEHAGESLGSLSSRFTELVGMPRRLSAPGAGDGGILSCAAKQVTRLGQESRSAVLEPQLT
jgi:Single-strand binding protein family